jgi:hypothetical protein
MQVLKNKGMRYNESQVGMERIQIKVSKTPGAFKCSRIGCDDVGVHRINERIDGEWTTLHHDFCFTIWSS